MSAQHHDELDAHIAESLKDPEYAAAYRAAEERHKRLVERPCRAGNCVELFDPLTGVADGGWGPVGCPCQDDAGTCACGARVDEACSPDCSNPPPLADHRLTWDHEAAEWFCGERGSVCGWHYRVPSEDAEAANRAHEEHLRSLRGEQP